MTSSFFDELFSFQKIDTLFFFLDCDRMEEKLSCTELFSFCSLQPVYSLNSFIIELAFVLSLALA